MYCKICNENVLSADAKVHVKNHASKDDGKIRCSLCSVKLRNKYEIANHIKIHHENMRFICKEKGCDKLFKSQNGLSSHIKSKH